mmetsp:Transcript_25695/g.46411  ORF Transcript_25695/g.46411 Transcript_25695/m.46411 type:complete len:161 (-) Transcript_25695:1257-1739(-)
MEEEDTTVYRTRGQKMARKLAVLAWEQFREDAFELAQKTWKKAFNFDKKVAKKQRMRFTKKDGWNDKASSVFQNPVKPAKQREPKGPKDTKGKLQNKDNSDTAKQEEEKNGKNRPDQTKKKAVLTKGRGAEDQKGLKKKKRKVDATSASSEPRQKKAKKA